MATVTNRKVSTANRGSAVIVTLDATDAAKLPDMTIGQAATVGSTSKVGYISSIDLYGTSFKVIPKTPDARWDSTATALLSVSEVITLA